MKRRLARRPALAAVIVAAMLLSLALPAAASLVGGDSARVAFTGGDGVNVRSAPSLSAGVIASLPEGAEISVLDGPVIGDDGAAWNYVFAWTFDGAVEGWARSDFLTSIWDDIWVSVTAFGAPDDSASAAGGVPAQVSTGGFSLNLRWGGSIWSDVATSIPDGAWVAVLDTIVYDESGNPWSLVRYGDYTGYVASGYLATGLNVPTAPAPAASGGGWVGPGQHAAVTGAEGMGVNVRVGPGVESGIVSALWDDTSVYVVDGPAYDANGDGWYQVEGAGAFGWVFGAYLGAAGGPTTLGMGGGGNAIVDLSYLYMGVPYLWGGVTPEGFDCSGFTWFILSNIVGDWYPRPMEDQIEVGAWVAPENLQPGDVIYFQNTYQWGVSHVGFYVGDGMFISASGEHDAVGVSSLWDPYWATRYLTARRVH